MWCCYLSSQVFMSNPRINPIASASIKGGKRNLKGVGVFFFNIHRNIRGWNSTIVVERK